MDNDTIEPVEPVDPVEEKITRSQEFIKCPKCDKMVTATTLNYSHKNSCSGEEQNKLKNDKTVKAETKPLPKPEPVHDIEEVPPPKPPKLVRQLSVIPEKVAITPEMMREHGQQIMRDRIQLRQNKMTNLFTNSIQ